MDNNHQAFAHWDKTREIVEQLLDIMLNYRQSGHPGGSRSKVYPFLATLLGGAMRWDIRNPQNRFADRFILGAGHTIPLIYCTLAVLNESLRIKHRQTGEGKYAVPESETRALFWEDLLGFRRRGGLSGHSEMEGKTLFLKFNTGPSGHGSPAAAGAALALKRAGLKDSRVFIFEGEGGLTPGATHETANSAWGLALDNLYYVVDWNDFGIDSHPVSDVVYGNPEIWFSSHGWRVAGTTDGEDWASVTTAIDSIVHGDNPERVPGMIWVQSRKGRGYLKYDNASHGTPHAMDSTLFWDTKRDFAAKYGIQFENMDGDPPEGEEAIHAEFKANLAAAVSALEQDQELVDYLAGRLLSVADMIPKSVEGFCITDGKNPYDDPRLYDYENYPDELYASPGEKVANRSALAKWGAWVNTFGKKEYDRPIFLASSADLAGSTNIAGFGDGMDGIEGYGWYERTGSSSGVLLPQEITEFTNTGIMAGLASVNMAADPAASFDGFWGATSTYGSFSYLMYGMLRLYSQLAQDCDLKVGKTLWVAGHSGPETADDSRTHFGIFSPGVTQLFPKGSVINLHPWEHNEVPVLLAAALSEESPIIALHLTRPPMEIPDRDALGMPSHFAAARGAYVVRDYSDGMAKQGTVIVQGTSAMANIIKLLPELERKKLNLKIICAASPQLFALQDEQYRGSVLSDAERIDSTIITTQARWLMHDWIFNEISEEYALSADWDDRWRTGGRLDEVLEEARMNTTWILKGLERFAADREKRLERISAAVKAAGS